MSVLKCSNSIIIKEAEWWYWSQARLPFALKKLVLCVQGFVEQDAKLLFTASVTCIDKTVENLRKLGLDPADIKGIGITNQRETIIAWDKLTGEALYNAIGKQENMTLKLKYE